MITTKIVLYTYQKELPNGYPLKIRFTEGKTKKVRYLRTGYYLFRWNGYPDPNHAQYEDLMYDFLDWNQKILKILPQANREQWSLDKTIKRFKTQSEQFNFLDFIETVNVKDRTKEAYYTAINSFPDFHSNINQTDVYKWLNDMTISNNSKSVYVRSLKALFNKAVKQGYIDKNPFIGITVPLTKTRSTALTTEDLIKIRDADFTGESQRYRDYYMLMFYLGGVLPIDIANLRQDKHIRNGRVEFTRFKGGTNELISNKIFPEAQNIIDKYNAYPYFTPIHKINYKTFIRNFQRRFADKCEYLNLTKRALPKSARSSFANRAKNLLIDRRICEDIMGHSRNDTHSIYEGDFTDEVRDEAHEKIISLKL